MSTLMNCDWMIKLTSLLTNQVADEFGIRNACFEHGHTQNGRAQGEKSGWYPENSLRQRQL